MNAVYYLLPLSLLLAVIAFIGYFWALRRGQFDDLDTPPMRILFEERPPEELRPEHSETETSNSLPKKV